MKILLFANTDWYLYNYRLSLARALRDRGDQVVLLSPPGAYAGLMQAQGFEWLPFPLDRKGMNPLTELVAIARLARLFRRIKPDLVHLFTIKAVLYGSMAARLAGIQRIICAITGLGYVFSDASPLLRFVALTLYRFSLGGAQVIFQNDDDRTVFLENGLVSSSRAHLIPGSGVDVDVFTPSPEPSGPPVVMLAARLLRSKGLPEFVEAARRIHAAGLSARFVIVGEPYPDNPDSIQPAELEAWQKEAAVEMWGWRDDMSAVLPQAAVICLPTRYREGLPRLLVEAGACARPVVASDIPGCRMVVREGENGLLIPPGDIDALTVALTHLLTSPTLRAQMGANGRVVVERELSVTGVISRTLDVYNQA